MPDMRRIASFLLSLPLLSSLLFSSPAAFGAITEADAKYAQSAGKATQEFSTAIGNWGDTYQSAPDKVNSPEYRNWLKKAQAADKAVKVTLTNFSKIKVSAGYKGSDTSLRKFIKAYNNAIDLYSPAIKKNDRKLVKKANDALMAATTLFTNWGNEFAKDTSRLAQ